jgi:hypothetical protein
MCKLFTRKFYRRSCHHWIEHVWWRWSKRQFKSVAKSFSFSLSGATDERGRGPPHSWGLSVTHDATAHSARLPRTGDRPVTEMSTWKHITLTRDRNPCHRNASKPAATDPRLRPLGHWNRVWQSDNPSKLFVTCRLTYSLTDFPALCCCWIGTLYFVE